MFGGLLAIFLLSGHPAQAAEGQPPRNTISINLGLPLPVGGLASLEWLHRFDEHNFVMVGGGTALVLSGVYLSFGRRFSVSPEAAGLWYVGFDNDYFNIFEGAWLPGVHAGVGKEWYTGPFRIALTLNAGFPWLGGLRLGVGL